MAYMDTSVDAEALAFGFLRATVPGFEGERAAERFRAALLAVTLEHAWKYSEYYRSVLPSSVSDGSFSSENLHQLPLLTKNNLYDNLVALRTSNETGIVQYTSGTTGIPIAVYRTEQEIKFLEKFYSVLQGSFNSQEDTKNPLILNIANLYHGNVINIPLNGYRITTGIFDPVLVQQAMRWLTTQHDIPGVEQNVSVITGLYHFIKWFTNILLENKFDFSKCSVEKIYLVGGFLSSRWQNTLKNIWSANIIPVYSLTEVFTYANQCQSCGSYHFLPNVIPELICPINQTPLEEGLGELVLTGLFPFVQGQPVIRYATKDIFLLNKKKCEYGDSYIFIGRKDNSCIFQVPKIPPIVLGSAVMHDIFDDEPDMAITPFFSDIPGTNDYGVIGKPKYTMKYNKNSDGSFILNIDTELRYSPSLYPERVKQLKTNITKKILQRCANLDDAVTERLVTIDITFKK